MKIQLDHVQRLNLHALLGAHRGDVATIRALWAIQDKLALTKEEENAIELKREIIAGQEHVAWNSALTLPPKDINLTDAEVARIRAALESWAGYGASADRRWLQPLVEALFSTGPAT